MPIYNVHVYLIVRELVCDIAADSQEAACERAEKVIAANPPANWAYAIDGFQVDEIGDTDHRKSGFYNSEYGKEW